MMKRYLSLMLLLLFLAGCSEEQQNKISRIGVTWLEGNYKVTFASGDFQRSWEIRDGKVTSEPGKGYYYFWSKDAAGKKRYIQTPVERTIIEEIE